MPDLPTSVRPTSTPPGDDPDRLFSFAEGCEFIFMSPRWVWGRVKDGTLPHVRLGRAIRFRRSSLLAWIAEREKGARS